MTRPRANLTASAALSLLIAAALVACGQQQRPAATAAHTNSAPLAPARSSARAPTHDVDADADANSDDYGYGRPASAAEAAALTRLTRSYYHAASEVNGRAACALLYSLFAEEIPETYGEPPGPPYMRGRTCAAVMTKLFEHEHARLAAASDTLKVNAVRIHRLRAHVIIGFSGVPYRDLVAHLEHGVWRVDELLDSPLG